MFKKTILALLVLALAQTLSAQDLNLYEKKWFISKGDTMPYRLLLPYNYDPAKKYPLILFMHGSGEKGNNNSTQLANCGRAFLKDSVRKNYPAFVLIPQCALKSNWVEDRRIKDSAGKYVLVMPPNEKPTKAMLLLQKLVKRILHDYPVNKKQLYVGGLSLGGMGTYDIVHRKPKLFAAAFPICGAADTSFAPKFKHVKWWVFHGANDHAVTPEFDKNIVATMQRLNIPVQFTLYPNTGHNSWDKALADPKLFEWLFSIEKGK
ncbi:alpha/beta hydrolase-fold protein [Parasediminibacterium sp. JCM 36343]|uniref:carboxylesterase family protein n=1 Tax=Parasediminibacterium sp. JCM 36343 TaxID=3374279 RepID=UPI00397B6876